MKWFIKGRIDGWIGPFETEEEAREFAYENLTQACQFWEKPADFEGDLEDVA